MMFRDGMLKFAVILTPVLFFAAEAPRSVWEGVYSAEQSQRGQKTYNEECSRCHAEALTGGENSPELVGADFLARWNGQTAGDLFEKMRTSMPTDSPGRLGRQQYADVLAYILNANKFPPGPKELDRETAALKQIKIEAKHP
jgi:mono/diheme cytochrome c family protein